MLRVRSLCFLSLSFFILPLVLTASTPAATPSLSVAGGSYQNPQTVTISDATAGASIYYTVTGVTPTTQSTLYTGPITVNRSMTLKAIAMVSGGTASTAASATYTILPSATPTISVAAGTYQSPQAVTLGNSTPGAATYYTVTGVTPTTLSTKYSGPITVSSSMKLQAIAAVAGGPVSAIASATYTILPAATPVLSVPGGTYQVYKSVTLSDATAGANIYYTVTGVTPTTASTLYTGPVAVNSNMTLQAIAVVPGGPVSPIASATYAFTAPAAPALNVAAGSYSSPQSVTISDSTAGANIYYTITGVTPTTLSTKYSGPVTVGTNMTLQAIAAIPGGPSSPVTSATYAIAPTPAPAFSVGGGTYLVYKSVTISDTAAGASIYYTVTGVKPTTSSTKYTGPIAVNSNKTLQAIAVVPGGAASAVTSATYAFTPSAAPALSVAAGSYPSPQTVTISDSTSGANVYYTVTGVTPTTLSTQYTGPVTVGSNMTLQAIAAIPGGPSSTITSAAYTIAPTPTPTFSIGGGTYQVYKSVVISDAEAGANIYYTVTGVTPTTSSTKYTGPISVNNNMTLQAIAVVPGGVASPVASATYAFVQPSAPALSVPAGSYSGPQTVTLSDATSGTSIYYTVTGVTPTTLSTKYSGPITVGSNMTLQAIAAISGGPPSPVASAVYSIAPTPAPTFSVGGGTYQTYKSVTISDAASGASIYYTVTGVTPTTMSTLYTGPVSVSSNMTLQAIAAMSGGVASPVTSAAYTFTPAATPAMNVAAGSYTAPQTVTISDTTAGATIYYTVTGVTPTTQSMQYTGPITVGSNMTLSAVAAIPGGPPSSVAAAAYTILPATAPTISEGTGVYQGQQTIAISDATAGANIYYTVTGTTPTTSSSPYTGPITVNSNMTLKTIAAVPGGPASPIATATYTIVPYSTPIRTPNLTASFFGMNVDHLLTGTPWPSMPFGAIRLWDAGTKWADLNPASTTFNWTPLDQQINMAQANGVDVLYTFGGTPPWALPTNVPIQSITRSGGTVTVKTTTAHGLYFSPTQPSALQSQFTVAGVTDATFNGTFYLTGTPDATTLTYAQSGTNGSSSSGAVSEVCGGAYAPSLCAEAPANLSQWDQYVSQLISHLGPGAVKYWEMWNEANDPIYWQGDPNMLVAMAKDAQSIIKAVDPAAIIFSPSTTGNYETAAECANSAQYCGTTWIANWLALGGANYIDAVGFHGYPDIGMAPEQVQGSVYQLQSAMSQYGVSSLPLWDTESSWTDNTDIPAAADQAAWLARHLLLEQSMGVQRAFWYAYDTPSWGTLWTSTSGQNTAAEAYIQVSKWVTGATLSQPCAEVPTDPTTFICSYTRPSGYVGQVVWNTAGAGSYTVPSQYVQYHDLTGAVHGVSSGAVQTSTSPILLENESVF